MLDEERKFFQLGDILGTADLRKTFSNGDTTSCSCKLYEITENGNDTKPSYKGDELPERYNEALLERTQLIMNENHSVSNK